MEKTIIALISVAQNRKPKCQILKFLFLNNKEETLVIKMYQNICTTLRLIISNELLFFYLAKLDHFSFSSIHKLRVNLVTRNVSFLSSNCRKTRLIVAM